ncbi:hypothetical protein O6H91_12G040300 [Diphasiastrum complanatum]|uniref:Uncharacterized protein n=1 Tax=Diphasiastrum complanatum TaxID=34168 RepID=A0ACC2C1C4_DIPCM|nr:hypothetical protein O6H91_12G040300 [Diphasiastrum complanatum]
MWFHTNKPFSDLSFFPWFRNCVRHHPLATFLLLILTPLMMVLLLSSSLTADGEIRGGHSSWWVQANSAPSHLGIHERHTNCVADVCSNQSYVFIAHGCYCRATFFWDRHADCEECIGLPEERVLILYALAKYYYGVLAISSKGHC